ncbi:hypothetical protein RhiJN_10362 [Ceratobasidium sp. AG-Ba]|nr:hypothetical protein RhiJN_10362 [Ceratobasidium sp. AG-Ba]QRW11085.1 hypothetical protein RhiLY_10084 [Ceratobasidium sp. AG-Ba]
MSHSPIHSPIKESGAQWENRTASDAKWDAKKLQLVSEMASGQFLSAYLANYTSSLPIEWLSHQLPLVQTIRHTRENEKQLYLWEAPMLRLLNSVSKEVHTSRGDPSALGLVFRSYDPHTIKSHHPGPGQKPDIVGIWDNLDMLDSSTRPNSATSSLDPPFWHSVATVGEVKLNSHDLYQAANYTRDLLRHHPELNAVLGFTTHRNSYRLIYHDASVVQTSEDFSWKTTPGPLYAFIRALYDRPFQDPSMVLLGPNNGTTSWATKIGKDVYVTREARPEIGPGQRRFTNLVIHLVSAMVLFIKDIWRDARRRYFEGELYRQAHSGQNLAGLMEVISYGYVLDQNGERITTTQHGFGPYEQPPVSRFKMRLLTSDVGRPLERARTLGELLRVIYDACAVQRNLYRKCGILHRDISDGNIMLAPDSNEYRERCASGYAETKFINQVLSENTEEKPNPTCLVIDLGNGANLRQGSSKVLTQRTGTPKFIARSISSGRLLDPYRYKIDQVQMPRLAGKALELYRRATGAEYEKYHDLTSSELEPDIEFKHQLFHDAESTFWVLAWVLARSYKQGSPLENSWKPPCQRFIDAMRDHCPGSIAPDLRSILDTSVGDWKAVLHPDLADLASMLSQMHRYIYPEWATQKANPEHTHEALMRLLLVEIVRIQEENADITLVIGGRALPPSSNPSSRKSQSTPTLSLGLSCSRSHTRSSLSPVSSLQENAAKPDNSTLRRKRSGSTMDEQPRRSPRVAALELRNHCDSTDWAVNEANCVTWENVRDLLPPNQEDEQGNGVDTATEKHPGNLADD